MKDDLIRRSDAIKAIEELPNCYNGWSDTYDKAYIIGTLEEVPSADVIERKRGEWIEKEVVDYEETTITQWQSACCSICGKYHTTPYLYYFDDFNYCPNYGSDMRKESE